MTKMTKALTEKDERAAWIEKRRASHYRALESLANQVGCRTPGLALWRQLRRIENWLGVYTVQYCNGDIDGDRFEAIKDHARNRISRVFGTIPNGVFINGDPRGYALKLDNEKVAIPEGMQTDWGGYGILAGEID